MRPSGAYLSGMLITIDYSIATSAAPGITIVSHPKVSQPTIIKKSSHSHRIAIQQHGMRGSIISILPADEMGCFCISQAYTRSLGHISGALGAYAEPWAAYHRPSHASGLSFALPRLSWNCRILSLPTVPRRWRVDTFWPRATEALERLQ